MNWQIQKSLKNVGTLVKKKKKRFCISQATLTIILIQLCRGIKSLGVSVIRCNLTSRHWAFLETAWAANEQKWWHTNRLRTSLPFVENLYESQGFFEKSYFFANGTIGVGVLTNPFVYIRDHDTCVTYWTYLLRHIYLQISWHRE